MLIAGAPIPGRDIGGESSTSWRTRSNVEERVVFTGYVGDEMLDRVLAATDVAACPFRDVSASGSLSTWISAGTRVVASDLPAIGEYDGSSRAPSIASRPAPGRRWRSRSARRSTMRPRIPVPIRRSCELAEQLALPRIVERYAERLAKAARTTTGRLRS